MGIKPILFNTEMVKAILDGKKTVTRRCVKYKYSNTEMQIRTDKYGTNLIEIQKDAEGETFGTNEDGTTWRKLLAYIEKRPPYKVNDILYVRETWKDLQRTACGPNEYGYRADVDESRVNLFRWRPSIHMPKEAARIFLRVTSIRVERLWDMTEADAVKEGFVDDRDFRKHEGNTAEGNFLELWDTTIKKDQLQYYRWNANPYVWVIEFERCEKPADMEKS